ncbi:MAG: MFS transporter [Anaerolineae bacterium]|nr:MFS transporter [Anaerolineae bacterium]
MLGRRFFLKRFSSFVFLLLAIEMLDEVVFGMREAAWPLMRDDLHLTYVQIGLLNAIPSVIANLIEPIFGILGDTSRRRQLVIGGGVVLGAGLILSGLSPSFVVLLVAFIIVYPATGAFVSLSQAVLMDLEPERHEQNMARWALAGSLGQVTGPLFLGLAVALGGGWRELFGILGVVTLGLALIARRFSFAAGSAGDDEDEDSFGLVEGLREAARALRRGAVLRWMALLQFANLMLDILLGYLALYFVDVVRTSESEAGIAVAIFTGVGLLGDVLLIPLLERVRGLTYLRFSVLIQIVVFGTFLLTPVVELKLVLIGLVGFFNAGWYSILQGQFYSSMPGQSGTVMALGNVSELVGGLLPLLIGVLAEQLGLGSAMWFLMLGPVALLVGLPRAKARMD